MCLIVDECVAKDVFAPRPTRANNFAPVHKALSSSRAVAVVGGRLWRKYQERISSLIDVLAQYEKKGALRRIDDARIDALEREVVDEARLVSDDPHIIALARGTRVRLLCSTDADLHKDFTNRRILDPPGSVFQKPAHAHLIQKHCRDRRARVALAPLRPRR